MTDITLFVPGLSLASALSGLALPRLPALERILARATRAALPAPSSCEAALFELFGVPVEEDGDLPVAAVTHLVDFDGDHEGCWMRADPVYLHADMSRLLLFESSGFKLDRDEAEALAREVNTVLGPQALDLRVGASARRWYQRLPRPPAIRTAPLSAAIGAHIAPLLPRGSEAARWHTLANEVQMILHASPVNARRLERGEPPINSLWWWGAGPLPAAVAPRWSWVAALDAVARGLAALNATRCVAPESLLGADLTHAEGSGLAVFDAGYLAARRGDAEALGGELVALERGWCAPLLTAMRRGRIQSLTVRTLGAAWRLRPRDLWRFWRRPGPVAGTSAGR